jgi:hypothetical protein
VKCAITGCPHDSWEHSPYCIYHETPADRERKREAVSSNQKLSDESTASPHEKLRRFLRHIANGTRYFHDDGFPMTALGIDAGTFLRLFDSGGLDAPAPETTADGDAITSLCDRLDRIHKIALDRVTNDSARLVMIANESEGFMPIPPCSICKQRHAEPEQDCPQLGAQKTGAES